MEYPIVHLSVVTTTQQDYESTDITTAICLY